MRIPMARRFTADRSGASAIEYGLIAGMIGVTAVAAMLSVAAGSGSTLASIASVFSSNAPVGVPLIPVGPFRLFGTDQAVYYPPGGGLSTSGTGETRYTSAGSLGVAEYGGQRSPSGIPWSVVASTPAFAAKMAQECAAGQPPNVGGNPLGSYGSIPGGEKNGVATTTTVANTPDFMLQAMGQVPGSPYASIYTPGDIVVTCEAPAG